MENFGCASARTELKRIEDEAWASKGGGWSENFLLDGEDGGSRPSSPNTLAALEPTRHLRPNPSKQSILTATLTVAVNAASTTSLDESRVEGHDRWQPFAYDGERKSTRFYSVHIGETAPWSVHRRSSMVTDVP